MQALLSFEQAPPFSAPVRFFLTAPLFLVLAAALLIYEGPAVFASRWMPASLAATHLVTVGFMLLVMCGALVQILPVVAGANIVNPQRVSVLVHAGLSAGALLLAAAFFFGESFLFIAAAVALAATVLYFLIATARALLPVPLTSPTIAGLKLSLLGACGVVGLGVMLALALGQGWSLPLIELANLHAAWGFSAWGGILLAAMSYVVVPMFQLTPPYRARPSWWLPPLLLLGVSLLSLGLLLETAWLMRLAEGCLAVLGLAFSGYTLYLQSKRRRARSDAPYLYWFWGLLSAILALAMSLAAAVFPDLIEWPGWALLFGVLLVLGGFVSLMIGMLYRIVPFLVWLHLQESGAAPNVGKILPDRAMRRQMSVHFLALLLCAGAVFFPELLARVAGLMLAVSGIWLFGNLSAAAQIYRQAGKDREE